MANVNDSITNNKKLLCIGYYLPKVNFKKLSFSRPAYFSKCKFQGDADFSEAKFCGEVSFIKAEFSGKVNFNKVEFGKVVEFGEVDFNKVEFSGEVDFNKVEFSGKAHFNKVEFSGKAHFNSAKFSREAYFNYAKFGKVDFNKVEFSGEVTEFNSAKFSGESNFNYAKFPGVVSFNEAQFSGESNFNYAKFPGVVYFSYAEFRIANFEHAKFEEAIFIDANFQKVSFMKAIFQKESNFSDANFKGETRFNGVDFLGKAYFRGARFHGNADFTEAMFQRVIFAEAKFCARVDFPRTKFQEVDFTEVKLLDKADFNRARFEGKTYFIKSEFQESNFYQAAFQEVYFSGTIFNRRSNFNYVVFANEAGVLFDTIDLSKVSLYGTDITRVRFGENVVWGRDDDIFRITKEKKLEDPYENFLFNWNNIAQQSEKNMMIHFLKNTIKLEWVNQDSNIKQGMNTNIIDIYSTDGKNSVSLILNDDRTTVSLVKSDKTLYEFVTKEEKGGKINVYYKEEISLDSVKAFYRSLKENYEYRHRYNEADKFFIREMELKRKYKQVVSPKDDGFEIKQNNWFRRNLFSFTGLYYHLSRYGQDYLRPALATLSLSILSTLFWGIQRSPSTLHPTFTNTSLHYLTNSTHIEKALERTLASLFQISYNQDFVIIDTFTRAVSLVFVGFLLMQALKRSFRR